MNEEALRERVNNLNVWKRGGERAPHKPLLLLYALGRCARGEPRLVDYQQVDESLERLLEEFGPPRRSHHPNYPFWRLENDDLWELKGPKSQQIRERSTDPSRRYLVEHDTRGGFPEPIHSFLKSNPDVIRDLAKRLLDENFPRTLHDDILAAVGLHLDTTAGPPSRDPEFREKVLRAYEYECGICGFDLRLRDRLIAVEAAHIKWHQAGGPDTESNGIALCSMHHKLFDRGAFTISNEGFLVLVSEVVNGSAGLNEWILSYHGRPIRGPQSERYRPAQEYLQWHAQEVFRPPPRDPPATP